MICHSCRRMRSCEKFEAEIYDWTNGEDISECKDFGAVAHCEVFEINIQLRGPYWEKMTLRCGKEKIEDSKDLKKLLKGIISDIEEVERSWQKA